MTAFDLAMLIAGVGTAGIAGWSLTLHRARLRWRLSAFAAAVAASLIATATARLTGPPELEAVGLLATVLAHPLLVAFVFAFLPGPRSDRRDLTVYALLGTGVAVGVWTLLQGLSIETLYVTFPLNSFLAVCYAIALADSIFLWRSVPVWRGPAYTVTLGTIILVVSGPVLTFETLELGLADYAGYLAVAPVAVLILARAARRTDALSPNPSPVVAPGRPGAVEIAPGRLVLLREKRPKFAREMFARSTAAGLPGMVFAPDPYRIVNRYGIRADRQEVPSGTDGLLKVVHTVEEFAGRNPQGILYLESLFEMVANAGEEDAGWVLQQLWSTSRRTDLRLIVSTTLLTDSERSKLKQLGFTDLALPDLETELEASLYNVTGGGRSLINAYCREGGRRLENLDTMDLLPFRKFLRQHLASLAAAAAEENLRQTWETQVQLASRSVEGLERISFSKLEAGEWPSRASGKLGPVVVRANSQRRPEPKAPLALAVIEKAFVDAFGSVGRHILTNELEGMGVKADRLSPRDVETLRSRLRQTLDAMGSVIDIRTARRDFEDRTAILDRRLQEIVGGAQ